jgi:hypothetical protein
MRSKFIALAVGLSALVALPALADDAKSRPSFPMPAAAFKQRVDARQAKAREHVEKRASQLPADQAKELRARFAASSTKVDAEVAKAIADGTVTKEEAAAVRAASPHGGGHCDGKGKTGTTT